MIAYLNGKIIYKDAAYIVVNCSGVGYKVFSDVQSLLSAKINDSVSLFVHTHVKEDSITLYGFVDVENLKLFEHLISVSGVGPKTALTIVSSLSIEHITKAVRNADTQTFTKISGVGTKMAQKIILELQPKLGKVSDINLRNEEADDELVEALGNLGFTTKEAKKMAENIDKDLPLEKKVKLSLKKK